MKSEKKVTVCLSYFPVAVKKVTMEGRVSFDSGFRQG